MYISTFQFPSKYTYYLFLVYKQNNLSIVETAKYIELVPLLIHYLLFMFRKCIVHQFILQYFHMLAIFHIWVLAAPAVKPLQYNRKSPTPAVTRLLRQFQ